MNKESKLTKKLQDEVKRLESLYSFIPITEDILKNYITTISTENYQEDSNISFEDFQIMQLREFTEETIKELINSNHAKRIINGYINERYQTSQNLTKNLNQLKKLGEFLFNYGYNLDFDTISELLEKNEILYTTLYEIVSKNYMMISSGNIEQISEDIFTISLIESFCLMSGISMGKALTEDSLNNDLDDVYKKVKKENISNKNEKNNEDKDEVPSAIELFLKEIKKIPLLTQEEEKEYSKRKDEGDLEARKILVERNLRLVVSIAKRYIGRGLQFGDLVQEGSNGLIQAVEKYDYKKGYKLSTYATWWIRSTITREIANKGRNIRVSVSKLSDVNKYIKEENNLIQKLLKYPSIEEVAEEMNISREAALELHRLKSDTTSLDLKIESSDGDTISLEQLIQSDENVEQQIEYEMLKEKIKEILAYEKLTDRMREVIIHHYGIDCEETSLAQIGRDYGLSREAIRKIRDKALHIIRQEENTKKFSIYMDNPLEAEKNLIILSTNYIEKMKETNRKNYLREKEKQAQNNKIKEKRYQYVEI